MWGAGCRVESLGCRVWGLGFKVWGAGFRVQGLGVSTRRSASAWSHPPPCTCTGSMVECLGFLPWSSVQGLGCGVQTCSVHSPGRSHSVEDEGFPPNCRARWPDLHHTKPYSQLRDAR